MIKPAIFEENLAHLEQKIKLIESISPLIHIDVATNPFVNGQTFLDVAKIDEISTPSMLELHLMVDNPSAYVLETFVNVERIISQIEAQNISDFIDKCKEYGYEVGLSLKPNTDIEAVEPFVDSVDLIQIMTVDPGGQGRPLQEKVLEKIAELKHKFPNATLQVDGGLEEESINYIETEIDIEHYVVGANIFRAKDPRAQEEKLQELVD